MGMSVPSGGKHEYVMYFFLGFCYGGQSGDWALLTM